MSCCMGSCCTWSHARWPEAAVRVAGYARAAATRISVHSGCCATERPLSRRPLPFHSPPCLESVRVRATLLSRARLSCWHPGSFPFAQVREVERLRESYSTIDCEELEVEEAESGSSFYCDDPFSLRHDFCDAESDASTSNALPQCNAPSSMRSMQPPPPRVSTSGRVGLQHARTATEATVAHASLLKRPRPPPPGAQRRRRHLQADTMRKERQEQSSRLLQQQQRYFENLELEELEEE